MLSIRCGTAHFFVGTIDGRARDPKAVKSPVELELWRVKNWSRLLAATFAKSCSECRGAATKRDQG